MYSTRRVLEYDCTLTNGSHSSEKQLQNDEGLVLACCCSFCQISRAAILGSDALTGPRCGAQQHTQRMPMRFLTLACVVAGARAHTESIAAIDAGKDTITLAAADPGTLVGTEVALIDATASRTCASAVGAASPLVVTGVDGAVLSFAAGSIVNSDVDAATNCKLSRDVSPVPGTVAGEKIFFTNVDEKSFKVSWATPANLGDYSADIVG